MNRTWLAALALWLVLTGAAAATPPGIYKAEVAAPLERVYPAVYEALEQARFWVVFEADMLANIAQFAERWGEDFNRSRLDGMRAMVVCNGWYTNAVASADPDLLALCPLRVSLYERGGTTAVVFARPTVVAQGSPGAAVAAEVEQAVIAAIEAGIAKVAR